MKHRRPLMSKCVRYFLLDFIIVIFIIFFFSGNLASLER
jgi:hypothetical protein